MVKDKVKIVASLRFGAYEVDADGWRTKMSELTAYCHKWPHCYERIVYGHRFCERCAYDDFVKIFSGDIKDYDFYIWLPKRRCIKW